MRPPSSPRRKNLGADLVPFDLGRDDAAAAARRELSNPAYHRDDEPWYSRILTWITDHLQSALDQMSSKAPGGWLGIAIAIVILVGFLAVLRMRLGPIRHNEKRVQLLFDGDSALTSAAHRATGDEYARTGRYHDALRERMRAIVRCLEERAIFEPRQGRTADEAANDATRVLPDVAIPLHEAARTFDATWYGRHRVDASTYARMVELDATIEEAAKQRPRAKATMVSPRQ